MVRRSAIMTEKSTRKALLALAVILALLATIAVATPKNQASANTKVTGSIFTSLAQPSNVNPTSFVVNANQYPGKDTVLLNGGPRNNNSSGILPIGPATFFFQVTGPSSNDGTDPGVLVSADPAVCRMVDIDPTATKGGRVGNLNLSAANALGVSCPNRLQFIDTINFGKPLQLCPAVSVNGPARTDSLNAGARYDANNWCDTTPNSGGTYKAWLVVASL